MTDWWKNDPVAAPSSGGWWKADAIARNAPPSTTADVAKGAGSGLVKGLVGLAGLPGAVEDGANWMARQTMGRVGNAARGQGFTAPTFAEVEQRRAAMGLGSQKTFPSADTILPAVENNVTGKLYEPQTMAGQYARTLAEFAPGMVLPGGTIGQRAAMAFVPAAASETAGQVTKGTPAEPYARAGAGVATGLGVAGVQALMGRPANEVLRAAAGKGLNENTVNAADALVQDALALGIKVPWDEALNHVSGGKVNLANVRLGAQGRMEGGAIMNPVMAERPGQIAQAAGQQFDRIAPVSQSPSLVGPQIGDAARRGMMATPEGQALAQAEWAAGPRVTPNQAGEVIQPELGKVYSGREGMRAALADQDYSAARNAPATIPLDGGFSLRSVTKHYDGPDIPILLNPAERAAARSQQLRDRNVTETMPVIGLKPTQFGQVDANFVAQTIEAQLQTAKGSVRDGLAAARRALQNADGSIDNTVQGLHNSRAAITDLIDQAKRAGAKNAVHELEGALGTLDQALEKVPAYGQARRNFQAASRPLEPFSENRAPGQIVARDQYNKQFQMPAERVPGAIEGAGVSGARDFASVASRPAMDAYEGYLVTQVLDAAGGKGLDLSSNAIRQALRQNEDALTQFPGVRARLEGIANNRDALDRLSQTPLGRLAQRDLTTQQAIGALFPTQPLEGSAQEVSRAMSALVSKNPSAARELVRVHAGTVFKEATSNLQAGANQMGGARFAVAIKGNPQQAENLEAVVKALPQGDELWTGFNRFLDIMEATGKRPAVGSNTAEKLAMQETMKSGSGIGEGINAVINPVKIPARLKSWYEQMQAGKNSEQLANILLDPKSVNLFRAIAKENIGLPTSIGLATRLTYMGEAGASKPNSNSPQQGR